MNSLLFSKIAVDNMIKNKNTYFPYVLSSIIMISLFYILNNVTEQVNQSGFYGDIAMNTILNFGVYVCGIFSVIFIFYTNSFLLKRRKKELGLYSVLGMEKKHISKVLFYEVIYSGGISLIGGLLTGMVFSRLMFTLLINMLNINTSLEFNISKKSIVVTIILFTITFFVVMISNLIRVKVSNPIDLIKGGKKGEKEPKGNIIIALLGLVFLGIGYYIALTIENPIAAIETFFIAVVCVSVATYLLFTSGSISLIKMLRKNKKFYYNKNNFISVSNMIYRMKQNAVGFANIALLSTTVLLILSTTISLYVGMEDLIKNRFPYNVKTTYVYENQDIKHIENVISKYAEEKNVEIKDVSKFFILRNLGYLEGNNIKHQNEGKKESYKNMYLINLIKLDDYNKNEKTQLSLTKDEVFIDTDLKCLNGDSINIYGKKFKVKSKFENLSKTNFSQIEIFNNINIVVSDIKELQNIVNYANIKDKNEDNMAIEYEYNFNINGEKEDEILFASTLNKRLHENIENVDIVESSFTAKESFYTLYGSLFFIGLFLGILFIIATVLIIYYKQISEGYDDKERFEILQKVGMSKEEVRKTIRSQILIVFYLPLLTAIIHIAVAFPLLTKIMAILNLTNKNLFLIFTGIVIIIFGIVYALVYRWTAKIYYSIVN